MQQAQEDPTNVFDACRVLRRQVVELSNQHAHAVNDPSRRDQIMHEGRWIEQQLVTMLRITHRFLPATPGQVNSGVQLQLNSEAPSNRDPEDGAASNAGVLGPLEDPENPYFGMDELEEEALEWTNHYTNRLNWTNLNGNTLWKPVEVNRTNTEAACIACSSGSSEHFLITYPCRHKYCIPCMNRHFKGAIQGNLFPPACCGKVVELVTVRPYLKSDISAYCNAQMDVIENSFAVHCALPSCRRLIPEMHITAGHGYCSACKTITCALCHFVDNCSLENEHRCTYEPCKRCGEEFYCACSEANRITGHDSDDSEDSDEGDDDGDDTDDYASSDADNDDEQPVVPVAVADTHTSFARGHATDAGLPTL